MYFTISTTTSIRLARRTSPVDHQSGPVKVLVNIQGDDGYTFALAATWRTCCTPRSLSKFLVDQDLADRNMLTSCKGHCKVLNAIAI